MMVLVDTSVWSSALRKSGTLHSPLRNMLATLIRLRRVILIGPVRQEILSGIKERKQFELLRDELSAFPDHAISQGDYEEAAAYFNECRSRGIQGSNTDFLICAVSIR